MDFVTFRVGKRKQHKVIISKEDAWMLDEYLFYVLVRQNGITRYVYCWKKGSSSKNRVLLHRFIMDAEEGTILDYINRNTLDNRREI